MLEYVSPSPSPIAELNRAVAVSHAESPDRALEIIDVLAGALAGYPLSPPVHGDLLRASTGPRRPAPNSSERADDSQWQ